MTRLNAALRNEIAENAVIRACAEEYNDLAAAFSDLAEDVRLASIGGAEREAELIASVERIHAEIDEIPEGLTSSLAKLVMARDNAISLNTQGERHYLYFEAVLWHMPLLSCDVKTDTKITQYEFAVGADHEFAKRIAVLNRRLDVLRTKYSSVESQTLAVLKSCTTVEKFLKIWPEAQELVPESVAVVASLPAVQTEELNKMLNLPTGESNEGS